MDAFGADSHGEHRAFALVCAVVPYGDNDAVVRLFMPTLGRIAAFARGARNSKRRFPGLVAPALGSAAVRPRRATELWTLDEFDTEPSMLRLGEDPKLLGYCGYLCELIERLLPEGENNDAVFDVFATAVRTLAQVGPRPVVLRATELKLLMLSGYLPDLSALAGGADCVAYDPASGQLLRHAAPGAVPFSEAARRRAWQLVHQPVALLHELEDGSIDELRVLSRLFAEHLRRHLRAPLHSVAFLRALDEA